MSSESCLSVCPGVPQSTSTSTTKWSIPKGRNLQKAVHNLRVTILCGFVTVLVLRGTIGIGTFGSQNQSSTDQSSSSGDRSSEPRRALSATNNDDLDDPEVSEDHPYTLGAAIRDWDAQRDLWMQQHPHMRKNSRGADRILLVTGSQPKPCDNPVGDHLMLKSIKNKIDYCRLHDIEIFYNMAHLDAVMAGFWAKLPLLRKLMLAHPEVCKCLIEMASRFTIANIKMHNQFLRKHGADSHQDLQLKFATKVCPRSCAIFFGTD